MPTAATEAPAAPGAAPTQAWVWCEAHNKSELDQSDIAFTPVALQAKPDPATGNLVRDAFYNCQSLVSVVISGSVKFIGPGAFEDCANLAHAVIEHGPRMVQSDAFRGCRSLRTLELPNTLEQIDGNAFNGCVELRELTFSGRVLGDRAFQGCTSLSVVNLGNELVRIGHQCFDGCTGLVSIEVPTSVDFVGTGAFHGCTQLLAVSLPNPRVMAHPIPYGVFEGCIRLQIAIAPALVGGTNHLTTFPGTPLRATGAVEDSAEQRIRLKALTYWARSTHHLCSPGRQQWVATVLMAAQRLRAGDMFLPPELWLIIIGFVPRYALGDRP